jgi:hypothetical protein
MVWCLWIIFPFFNYYNLFGNQGFAIYYTYKDESMYVCVCVCVYVRQPATGPTKASYHPEIWRGLLISPWLGTKQGGDHKCWPRGYPL